jgi:HAD superfamily hydrolase (TIGR01509 family)
MVKAIVFDCFGVLASEMLTPFLEKYFGSDPKLLTEVPELVNQATSGVTSYDDFMKKVSTLAGISEQEAREQIEGSQPDIELFSFIEVRLKPSYKIGLLSNVGGNRLAEIFTHQQIGVFDAIGLSYEIGASKPDPIAYMAIADRLGVKAEECVFVDDQPKYCDGAMAVGMEAILYDSFNSFTAKLETVVGVLE